ncbi:MAG TPA: imidazolonepropionase [Terriglobales bacterium]|nr:imidazolonepropionase [Terriglobales bacterium]
MRSPQNKSRTPRPVLLVNIGQLLTLRSASGDPGPRRSHHLKELGIIEDGAVLCVGGKIVSVGSTREASRDLWIKKNRNRLIEIDCAGRVALPGFVDSHTHPAFVSPRLVDFEKRIAGARYEQIAEAGGGIRSSLETVRSAKKPELAAKVLASLQEMMTQGTTTVEAKSGYGLSLDSELKSLEAIQLAAAEWPGTVVPTLLGAHVVPDEFRNKPQKYVEVICDQMIPQVSKRKLARFVDVFCDRGAFSEQDCLRIFSAARKNGLHARAHVSQLARTPLAKLLAMNPVSLDHVDHVDETDVAQLTRSGTIATLVPGANYFLGLKYPPARTLIDAGAAIALATDFNPGSSPTASMPFILSLACTQMKMSPAESITAATINAAYALQLEHTKGSIEPGKDADIAIFNVRDHRELPYWTAANRREVVIAGGAAIECRRDAWFGASLIRLL